ncbi:MAG: FtsX-like permease family protein [Treponemataceae bacterium]|nr:FtsX-like permease family protein [Treponemataceae bacterium]
MWLEKHRNILDFTLSSLLRRKGKNLALTLVYICIVFFLASVMFFTHALKKEAAIILKDAPEIMVQRLLAGRHDLIPLHYGEVIQKIRGVESVKGRLWGYYFDPTNGANYTVVVHEERSGSGSITIGKGIERNLAGNQYGTLPLKTSDGTYLFLKVKETLSSESELVSSDLILISEADFKKIFAIPEGFATDLIVRVRNPKELTTIATKITQLLPDTRPILKEEILRTYDAAFNWRGGLLLVILLGAVFAFVILAWEKASGLSVEEKREIGILKAIGWETSDILLMKFWEGMVVSLSSFLLGLILAYLHVFFSSSFLFEPVLKGWAVLYPEFRLTPFIDFYQIVALLFLTVVPYTVATIIPSWRTATVDPDMVMRGAG